VLTIRWKGLENVSKQGIVSSTSLLDNIIKFNRERRLAEKYRLFLHFRIWIGQCIKAGFLTTFLGGFLKGEN